MLGAMPQPEIRTMTTSKNTPSQNQGKTTSASPAQPLWAYDAMDVDAELMDYCAQEDVLLDNALLPFDVAASLAHVHGLQKIGILDEN